jgi:RNA polymerase sigma-70 factor (ECF subfamily)
MNDLSDEELIAAHHRGDEGALACLVGRHTKGLGAYCYQMTLDRHLAEDLAQETFVKAIRSLGTFRQASSFKTWLFRIATNVVRDSWSRTRKEVLIPDDDELHSDHSPERQAMDNELDDAIRSGLAELPLALRTALVLTSLQGVSPQEVATMEGCTVSTVYWRVHEARKLMKRRLHVWIG